MNFTLILTEQELNVLSEALGELSFKKSAALISKLQLQIDKQQKSQVEEPSTS